MVSRHRMGKGGIHCIRCFFPEVYAMSSLLISGGCPLNGGITVQGSKNTALPLMAAALLLPGVTRLEGCPDISDVSAMSKLLEKFGANVYREGNALCIDAASIKPESLQQGDTKKTRACVLLLGAMLARCGEARMAHPGGCAIGSRPVDLHLEAFRCLGAEVVEEENISCKAAALAGGVICFPFPSVGATQNAILASVLAEGTTRIHNAAAEPEVAHLCLFLNQAGALVEGIGGRHLVIHGVKQLAPVSYRVPADRIVAGTYMAAVLAAGGEVLLKNAPAAELRAVIEPLRQAGGGIHALKEGLLVKKGKRLAGFDYLCTAPYPGFPTDMQPQFIALAAGADGASVMEEAIFDARFRAAGELNRMGARIYLEENRAVINGVEALHGARITAADLRGAAALVIAALYAEGETVVDGYEYIERGYEDIVRDLSGLGAKISIL